MMNKRQIRFFELARRVSKFSDHRQHKLGAVLVNKNRVLNMGFNSCSTHPKSPNKWFSTHAEFATLIGIEAYKIRGSDVYVARSTSTMSWANSKPCRDCEVRMRSMGVRRVYYINENREFASYKIT